MTLNTNNYIQNKVFLHLKKTKLISLSFNPFQKLGKKGKQNHPLTFRNNPTSSLPSHPRNNPLKRSLPFKKNTIPIPFSKGVEKEKYPISFKKQPLAGRKSPPPFPTQKIALLKILEKKKNPKPFLCS